MPLQANGFDCGVFVCRYAYAMMKLRNKRFTYKECGVRVDGKRKGAFQKLITESEAFVFGPQDIDRLRGEIRTLVQNLSDMFATWKKEQTHDSENEETPSKPEVVALPHITAVEYEANTQGDQLVPSSKGDMITQDLAGNDRKIVYKTPDDSRERESDETGGQPMVEASDATKSENCAVHLEKLEFVKSHEVGCDAEKDFSSDVQCAPNPTPGSHPSVPSNLHEQGEYEGSRVSQAREYSEAALAQCAGCDAGTFPLQSASTEHSMEIDLDSSPAV